MGIFGKNKVTAKDLPAIKVLNTQEISQDFFGGNFTSYNNFIENDTRQNIDLMNIYTTFKKAFVSMFEWNGLKLKEARKLEQLLFRGGKAAILVLPNGELFITNFHTVDGKKDNYGYPLKIKILNKKSILDQKIISKNFAVIYNNSEKYPTLLWVWKRVKLLIESIERNDLVVRTSDFKIPFGETADDDSFKEMNKLWYSLDPFIKVNTEWLRSQPINPIQISSNSLEKQDQLIFQLNLLLTFLGFKTGDIVSKAERQTELEINNNDKFNGLLIKNMFDMRKEGSEDIKEKLGKDISPKEPDFIKEKEILEKEENKLGDNNE